jgi:hypothetical protein
MRELGRSRNSADDGAGDILERSGVLPRGDVIVAEVPARELATIWRSSRRHRLVEGGRLRAAPT